MPRPAKESFTTSTARERQLYRLLVQKIHGEGLRPGDKLPPQESLRPEFGASNVSLSKAMNKLVADGMIERKTRVGTVVANPNAVDMSAWTVALPLNWNLGSVPPPFYARLTGMLQQGLALAGCECRAYPKMAFAIARRHRTTDFLNLQKDIDAGLIDAILTPTDLDDADLRDLDDRGIATCFATSWNQVPCGTVVDNGVFARDACRALAARRVRHIGLVSLSGGTVPKELWAGAEQAAQECPNLELERIGLTFPDGTTGAEKSLAAGRNAAAALMARPEDKLPEALVIPDDHVASALTHLLRLESDYRPLTAVMTHRAAPMVFHLPVLHFELDDQRLAEDAVEMLLARLRNPQLPKCVERVAPRLIEDDAMHVRPVKTELETCLR